MPTPTPTPTPTPIDSLMGEALAQGIRAEVASFGDQGRIRFEAPRAGQLLRMFAARGYDVRRLPAGPGKTIASPDSRQWDIVLDGECMAYIYDCALVPGRAFAATVAS